MRFPIDVILVCIRWYAPYLLSYRYLEEMMAERGVEVDHSSICWLSLTFGIPELHMAAVAGFINTVPHVAKALHVSCINHADCSCSSSMK